jgi:hypothetical protein
MFILHFISNKTFTCSTINCDKIFSKTNFFKTNTTMAYPTQCTKSGIVYSTNMDVSNNNIEIPVSSNYEYKIVSFSNSNCTGSPYMYQFSKKHGCSFALFGYLKQTISDNKFKNWMCSKTDCADDSCSLLSSNEMNVCNNGAIFSQAKKIQFNFILLIILIFVIFIKNH